MGIAPFSEPPQLTQDSASAVSLAPALPGGREAYLLRQRRATRSAIMAAARGVFADSNYIEARIDAIIRAAGVSRATFYAHFASKLELAFAIYDDIVPQSEALFAGLPVAARSGRPGVVRWLRGFIALHVEHRYVTPLIAQLQLFERGFRDRILRDADTTIDRLGEAGIGSCAAAQGSDRAAVRHRVRARLVMNRVAAVCAEIARDETGGAEADMALTLVADELLDFLRE